MRLLNWKSSLLSLLLLGCCPVLPAADNTPELSTTLNRLESPQPAPDFTLKDMDGKPHSLHEYRGKVVLLNFWATWCPPCRKEMPSLDHLYRELRKDSFMVLALNEWESEDHVFSYMGDLNVFPEFPVLFDHDSKVAEEFGVRGLPTSLIIDAEGRIVYKAVGGREFDHPDMVRQIRQLLPRK